MKKVTKINLRVISKCHAHFQFLTKTPVKFQKDWEKIVGGVALTKYLPKWWTNGRMHGRTWATLNALPHSTNSGGIIKRTSRLGRLLALSLEILYQSYISKYVVQANVAISLAQMMWSFSFKAGTGVKNIANTWACPCDYGTY